MALKKEVRVNSEKMIKQEFNVGDEFISRLDGVWGYVVLPFKGFIVQLSEREGRLFPERYLASDKKKERGRDRFVKGEIFEHGERVRIIPTGKKGKILDVKQFYVVHFRNGEVKVLIQEIMAKSREKIISPIALGVMQQGAPLIFPGKN